MEKECSCGFLLVREIEGRNYFLILKSKAGDFYWEFAKGHKEDEESDLQTAIRELREETGITEENFDYYLDFNNEKISSFYEYTNGKGVIRYIVLFLAKTHINPIISHEHTGYLWATKEEAREYLKFEETINCFNELLKKANL